MNIPKAFALTKLKQQRQLVEDYPFATVINAANAQGKTVLDAQQLPLYWQTDNEQQHYLYGHVAKNNPLLDQAREAECGREVLCIFQGPQAYISPNWYPTKQQTGKAVPTWNYVAVHIHGSLTLLHESHKKMAVIEGLTHKMEATIEEDPKRRWQLSDAPKEYIEKMLQGIVGIEITVTSIEGQCKLSQNQPAINIDGVVNGLGEASQYLAKAMKEAIITIKYQ